MIIGENGAVTLDGKTWKLVPDEPTAEMLNAPLPAGTSITGVRYESRLDLRPLIYRAMLAASPPPPAGAAGGGSGDLGALSAGANGWCGRCDENGHLHRLDGEFAGVCDCMPAPTPDLGAQGEPVWVKKYKAECQRSGADFDAEACITENFPQIVTPQQPAAQGELVGREAVLAVVRAAWALVDNTGHHDLLPLAINRDDWNDLAARLAALKALLPAEELPADAPHAVVYFWPASSSIGTESAPDLGAQGEPVAWAYDVRDGYNWVTLTNTRRPKDDGTRRNIRPLYDAPAAPRSDSGVTADRDRLKRILLMWKGFAGVNDTQGQREVESTADAIFALLQAPRPGETGDDLDADRFRALMRCGRIKMQGSAGVDPKTGERTYASTPGRVHFGAEFWPDGDADPDFSTQWGRYCLRALADDILALEAAPSQPHAAAQAEEGGGR